MRFKRLGKAFLCTSLIIVFVSALGSSSPMGVKELGSAFLMYFVTAFVGPFVGLLSTNPYHAWQLKLIMLMALAISVALLLICIRGKQVWWRDLVGVAGSLLLILAGALGLALGIGPA